MHAKHVMEAEMTTQSFYPKTFEEMKVLISSLRQGDVKDNQNIYNMVMDFFLDDS